MSPESRVETLLLSDDGTFPNNSRLAVLVYRRVFETRAANPESFEQLFGDNDWYGGWRDGVFLFHHYHSTAHEVLGCYAGDARVQLGGSDGPVVEIARGDVVVLPAGVSHRRVSASAGFAVVGAYAGGRDHDMNYGKPGERPRADRNIAATPLPKADPVHGTDGPLLAHWRR